MKRRFWGVFFLIAMQGISVFSQAADADGDLIPDDLDSLFEESSDTEAETVVKEKVPEETLTVLDDLAKQTGFTFQARYAFVVGYSPGWGETPWNDDADLPDGVAETKYNHGFSQVIGADIGSDFSLDFQLSPAFRVKQTFLLRFPDYDVNVSEFWGVYNYKDAFYLKMGKFEGRWGLGRNYGFTNLPSRTPQGVSGDAYTVQADIPLGLGGLQLLALTRSGYVEGGDLQKITAGDMGYGAKYNLAATWADMTLGSFYHADMDPRSYLSMTSTLWGRTEVYAEGLWSMDKDDYGDNVFSGNFGFYDEFFHNRLIFNGEYFWNGEKDISYVDDDNELIVVEKSPYLYGHNVALNLGFKPKGSSLNLFIRGMYNVDEETAKIIPGLRMKLMNDFDLYCAVPMALGERNGTYYRSNYDEKNRPFSINIALRLDGSYKFAHYR